MTQEQFLNGTPFRVITGSNYKGASTFTYDGKCLLKQSRSSIDERILFQDYHLNVSKVGKTGFEGFTYVMEKLVKVKFKYTELQEFIEEV